jgi:hypothetical protein
MSNELRCPLCNKWLPDLNAAQNHMFSARHNGGQDVIDALLGGRPTSGAPRCKQAPIDLRQFVADL